MQSTSSMDDQNRDNDEWQIPEDKGRVYAARVKILQSGIAAEILAIPDDITPRARKRRITQSYRKHADRFMRFMTTTYAYGANGSVRIEDDKAWREWWDAGSAAWAAVQEALEAGTDLTSFLWPSEAVEA